MNPYSFHVARSESQKARVYDFRHRFMKDHYPYLLTTGYGHPAKDRFDDLSIIFYGCYRGEVVSTVRTTPRSGMGWEIAGELPPHLDPSRLDNADLEINRVYIDENHRGKDILFTMFHPSAKYLLEQTPHRRYFGVCNAGMARMYKSIGARNIYPGGFTIARRNESKYFIVEGLVDQFIQHSFKKIRSEESLHA